MSAIELPKRQPPTESSAHAYRRGRSARAWYWTAGSGIALVALATMHIVAQHFIVHQTGGLRTYSEVLSYIANPVIFILESGFLFAVTIHAMLGYGAFCTISTSAPGPSDASIPGCGCSER